MNGQARIQTLLQAAMGAAQRRDFAAAETACRQALALNPDHADTLQVLGLIVQECGRTDEAVRLMRRSLERAPAQPHVWNNLGNALAKSADWRAACGCYDRAVSLAPGYVDGWLNLARFHERAGDPDKALDGANKALALKPGHAGALGLKGRLLNTLGRPGEALPLLEQAVAANPKAVEAIHNLGVALRQTGAPDRAIVCYRQALALRPDSPDIHFNLANAFSDCGRFDEALNAYRTAVTLRPDYAEAHDRLNKLLWELGRRDLFARSLPPAIARTPQSPDLALLYGRLLMKSGDLEGAAATIEEAVKRIGAEPPLLALQAKVEADQGHTDRAQALFEKVIRSAPDDMTFRQDYARLLIKQGEYQAALSHLDRARERDPLDQQILAYLGLCWRFLGDPRSAWLNDYERFVQPMRLAVPDGYASLGKFNAALGRALDGLHRMRSHPIDQTLRGGTQTQGALFKQALPDIQALKRTFEQAIAQYVDGLPDDPHHPFLSRKTKSVRFSGAWSIRLQTQGFHVNHVHSQGWISSAYYVRLPDCVADTGQKQGWLTFGETNLGLGERERVARAVKPEEGTLVLFPSYLFHGTRPFDAPQDRMTVAFDCVPAH